MTKTLMGETVRLHPTPTHSTEKNGPLTMRDGGMFLSFDEPDYMDMFEPGGKYMVTIMPVEAPGPVSV